MAERCDFYSDDEWMQACHMEEAQMREEMEKEAQMDCYQIILEEVEAAERCLGADEAISFLESGRKSESIGEEILENASSQLGTDTCISYLKHLKNKFSQENKDECQGLDELPF